MEEKYIALKSETSYNYTLRTEMFYNSVTIAVQLLSIYKPHIREKKKIFKRAKNYQ